MLIEFTWKELLLDMGISTLALMLLTTLSLCVDALKGNRGANLQSYLEDSRPSRYRGYGIMLTIYAARCLMHYQEVSSLIAFLLILIVWVLVDDAFITLIWRDE